MSSALQRHAKCIPTNGNNKKMQGKTLKPINLVRRKAHGKEVVQIITRDLVRYLIIPKDESKPFPACMSENEYKRMKNESTVITMKDRLEMVEKAEAMKKQKMKESAERRAAARKMEVQMRATGTKLNEIEIDCKRRADHLLKRALELRYEQEDEIKKATQLIMGTKCHAIRDAQVVEKKLIKKELDEEEARLDQMMEDRRRHELKLEEQRKEKERVKKLNFITYLKAQIKENDIERVFEAEHVEEESRMMNELTMQMQLDELEAIKQKVELQEKMREELTLVNKQLLFFQEVEREEARISDIKIQEFMRQKAEREEARELEISLGKAAKEQEIARLRALQERQNDLQAEADELNARRNMDEVEREWRRKEKEATKLKAENNEKLRQARQMQIKDRYRMQAMEIARDKREFENVLKVQEELRDKDQKHALLKHKTSEAYRDDILGQINEKELKRVKQRQDLYKEGLALKLEDKARNFNLREVMLRKVDELRQNKVPDSYVKDIAKQLNLDGDPDVCLTLKN